MAAVDQRLSDAERRLNDHHVRLLDLERDRRVVHELVAQTRALAEQASRSLTQLDAVAERAVEKVLHRRDEHEREQREERRDGWRYRLVWGGFLATGAYTAFEILRPFHHL